MSRDAHLLAHIMCQLTESVVWTHAKAITESHGHQMKGPLVTRSGAGLKTYHTTKSVNGQYSHVITYGKKMLEKKKDFGNIPYILTGREIKEKGFYDGELSYKNLLSHLMVHETAHAIQRATGQRHKNDVHNKAFYSLLTELHNACGQQVVDELEKEAVKQGISLDFHPDSYQINEDGKLTDALAEIRNHQAFAIEIRGGRCLVVVTDVGEKKSEILIYHGKEKGCVFNAPNRMLKPLEVTDRQPDPENDIPKTIDWVAGDFCHFHRKNQVYHGGYIRKVNPKNCVVTITEGPVREIGRIYDIPTMVLKEGNREFPKTPVTDPSRTVQFDFGIG